MNQENENRELNQASSEESGEIKLSVEQYSGLLERLAELENAAVSARRYGNDDDRLELDDLVQQGTRRQQVQQQQMEPNEIPNFDQMSNTDLVKFIFKVVDEQGSKKFKDIETRVERLFILDEINKVEKKYDDFWLYDKEVQAKAQQNPRLSIEDAYKLAKSEDPERASRQRTQKSEGRQQTHTEKILRLPPISFGEKPGHAAGSMNSTGKPLSLREAAMKAWNENVGDGKTEV